MALPLQRLTLADQVAVQLEAEVLTLQPGTALPSEATLAKRFGVNRLVVREVSKTLQTRGLLQVRQGRPAVVVDSTDVLLRDFFRLSMMRDDRAELELLEVRRALEVFFVGLAAERAEQSAIQEMHGLVAEMKLLQDTVGGPVARERFMDADLQFHSALATASGNLCARVILSALSVPLRRSRARSLEGALRIGAVAQAANAHQQILEAVEQSDTEAARSRMMRHLDQTERDLRAAGVSASTADSKQRTSPAV